jgi:hypothetical protein
MTETKTNLSNIYTQFIWSNNSDVNIVPKLFAKYDIGIGYKSASVIAVGTLFSTPLSSWHAKQSSLNPP